MILPILSSTLILFELILDYSVPKCYADKVINRQLSASISSSTWPTTPTSPLCEAYAYLDSSPSSLDRDRQYYTTWKAQYLSSLISLTNSSSSSSYVVSTYDDGIKLALNAAKDSFSTFEKEEVFSSTLDSNLLSFALATRAHSPQCEMYRSLSKQALSVLGLNHEINAFVVVEGKNEVYTSVEEIVSSSNNNGSSKTSSTLGSLFGFSKNEKEKISDAWANILPKEDVYYKKEVEDDSNPLLILYGQFHTNEFSSLLKYLQKQKYPHVVRYMGYTAFESNNNKDKKDSMKTFLQGYGVKVDIRNLEYKSYDEKESNNDDTITNDVGSEEEPNYYEYQNTLNIDVIKEKWIKGIDSELLSSHASSPELLSFIKDHLPHLESNLDNYHLPIIPPRSELQNISLAAATVIHQSVDPLWTLIQLSQNLPSHAYALSNITIPDSILKLTQDQLMEVSTVQKHQIDGLFQFYVNGRRISVERPSFNLFQLFNVLREENAFLQNIQNTMKDYLKSKEAMSIASSLLSMGKDNLEALAAGQDEQTVASGSSELENDLIRIDVGRGYKNAILYFNDIEKDLEYSSWPNEVQNILMSLQFGRPPSVKRNMITVLMVIDPFDSNAQGYLQMMGLMFQFIQGMYPLRLGVLLANDKDIEYCKQSILSFGNEQNKYCLNEKVTVSDEDMKKQPVSTQEIFALLNHVQETHGGMIAMNYMYVLMQSLMKEKHNQLNVESLIKIHNDAIYEIIHERENRLYLQQLLFIESAKLVDLASYEKAVRFACSKNIRAGMTFVNGIPIPQNDPREAHSIIQDEINHIAGMVLSGKVTNARKSIYAKLLTGPKVYSKMHPLLGESTPRYHLFSSYFDDQTLVVPKTTGNNSNPKILCEAYVDFNSDSGLNLVESFLSSIKRKVESLDNHDIVNLSFRVLPSGEDSAGSFLAKVFLNANQFGLDSLLLITETTRTAVSNGYGIGSEEHFSRLDDTTKKLLENLMKQDHECSQLPWTSEISGSILVNGRLLRTNSVSVEDIDTLLELEVKTAKAIMIKLGPFIEVERNPFVSVARFASFVGSTFVAADSSKYSRADALASFQHIVHESSPLYYDWQSSGEHDDGKLKVRRSCKESLFYCFLTFLFKHTFFFTFSCYKDNCYGYIRSSL